MGDIYKHNVYNNKHKNEGNIEINFLYFTGIEYQSEVSSNKYLYCKPEKQLITKNMIKIVKEIKIYAKSSY